MVGSGHVLDIVTWLYQKALIDPSLVYFSDDASAFTQLTPRRFESAYRAWLRKSARPLTEEASDEISRFAPLVQQFVELQDRMKKIEGYPYLCFEAAPQIAQITSSHGFETRVIERYDYLENWQHLYTEVRVAGEWLLIETMGKRFEGKEIGVVILPRSITETAPFKERMEKYNRGTVINVTTPNISPLKRLTAWLLPFILIGSLFTPARSAQKHTLEHAA